MAGKQLNAAQLEFGWEAEAPQTSELRPPVHVDSPPTLGALIEHTSEVLLLQKLEEATGTSIALTLTNNRKSMMHMRSQPGGSISLRLHHRFLEADDNVLDAVAAWITKPRDRTLWPVLDAFFASVPEAPPSARRVRIQPHGSVYDLQQIYDELNARQFSGSVTAKISWASNHIRRRRTICLGSYAPATHIIRIHPNLDDEKVPLYFVRFVVFHEMLHAHLGIGTYESGRRAIHPKAFRDAERAYPDYERAEAWIKDAKNLRRVMRKRAGAG